MTLGPEAGGRISVEGVARKAGSYRLTARLGELEAESNPLVVADGPRVLWGDLHGHTNYADGTGTPEDYFVYARDVSALDVAAITEHDHWGILPLVRFLHMWKDIALVLRSRIRSGTAAREDQVAQVVPHLHALRRKGLRPARDRPNFQDDRLSGAPRRG